MVLRSVQGKKHGSQPLSQPQGQLQKLAPRPLRERDERQLYQPQTQQAISIDSDSRPLHTAHPAPHTIPSGKAMQKAYLTEKLVIPLQGMLHEHKQKRPTRRQGLALRPLEQHNRLSSKPMLLWKWRCDILGRRKRRGDVLSPLPGLHDTISSGKDTGRLARSSDLCRGRSTGYNTCQNRKDINKNLGQAQ